MIRKKKISVCQQEDTRRIRHVKIKERNFNTWEVFEQMVGKCEIEIRKTHYDREK